MYDVYAHFVASTTLMLSTPTPALPTILSFFACCKTLGVTYRQSENDQIQTTKAKSNSASVLTLVAERTTRPS
jgi:hypothetical protein